MGPRHPRQGILDLSLTMKLPAGELFTLAQSYNVEQFRWRLTFIGEQGTFDFDNGTLYDAWGATVVSQRSVVDLDEQDADFVASIREGRDPAITGEEVLPAMRILDEAESSAASG